MTKAKLQEARHLDSDLRILRRHLKELESMIGITSAPMDGQPKGTTIGNPTEAQALRLSDLITEIKAVENKVIEQRIEIWNYVSGLQDNLLRQIIVLRFIDGKSWYKVSEALGYATSDGCRMYFNRTFKEEN